MDFTAFEVRTIQTRRRQNKKTFLESILKVFAGWAGRASGNHGIYLSFFLGGGGKIILLNTVFLRIVASLEHVLCRWICKYCDQNIALIATTI